ncbi:MAG TPA: hypothetical protein VMR70_05445, partial [Flavisolibacter sp.]|nr:hypothetical protein [Flavisolibacter sp.]
NPSDKYPRAALGYSNRSTMASTEFLENADFFKIRSLTIGYTFSESFTRKLKGTTFRLYATGVNLLTVTNYSGMDPEDGDYGNTARFAPYPITRSFVIGANLSF